MKDLRTKSYQFSSTGVEMPNTSTLDRKRIPLPSIFQNVLGNWSLTQIALIENMFCLVCSLWDRTHVGCACTQLCPLLFLKLWPTGKCEHENVALLLFDCIGTPLKAKPPFFSLSHKWDASKCPANSLKSTAPDETLANAKQSLDEKGKRTYEPAAHSAWSTALSTLMDSKPGSDLPVFQP